MSSKEFKIYKDSICRGGPFFGGVTRFPGKSVFRGLRHRGLERFAAPPVRKGGPRQYLIPFDPRDE